MMFCVLQVLGLGKYLLWARWQHLIKLYLGCRVGLAWVVFPANWNKFVGPLTIRFGAIRISFPKSFQSDDLDVFCLNVILPQHCPLASWFVGPLAGNEFELVSNSCTAQIELHWWWGGRSVGWVVGWFCGWVVGWVVGWLWRLTAVAAARQHTSTRQARIKQPRRRCKSSLPASGGPVERKNADDFQPEKQAWCPPRQVEPKSSTKGNANHSNPKNNTAKQAEAPTRQKTKPTTATDGKRNTPERASPMRQKTSTNRNCKPELQLVTRQLERPREMQSPTATTKQRDETQEQTRHCHPWWGNKPSAPPRVSTLKSHPANWCKTRGWVALETRQPYLGGNSGKASSGQTKWLACGGTQSGHGGWYFTGRASIIKYQRKHIPT